MAPFPIMAILRSFFNTCLVVYKIKPFGICWDEGPYINYMCRLSLIHVLLSF